MRNKILSIQLRSEFALTEIELGTWFEVFNAKYEKSVVLLRFSITYLPPSISNLSKNLWLKAHPAQRWDIPYRQYAIESTFWHIVDQSAARAFANTQYASGFRSFDGTGGIAGSPQMHEIFPRHRSPIDTQIRTLYDVTATPLAICEITGRFAASNETKLKAISFTCHRAK